MKKDYLANLYRTFGQAPGLHVVLGSGLSFAFDAAFEGSRWELVKELSFSEIPDGKASSVQGHKGSFRYLRHRDTQKIVCVQIGRLHGYEGYEPWDAIQPVVASALAGTESFILTNAAGSLNPNMKAGSVMMIRDHVNLTGKNPLHGPNKVDQSGKPLGPRFQDLSSAWDKDLNATMRTNFETAGLDVSEGVYLGLMGPTYETPAEVQMFQRWGLDAVGMSTVWECIALKYLGKKVGGFSFISNLGAGLSPRPLSHEEVEETAKLKGAQILKALMISAERFFGG